APQGSADGGGAVGGGQRGQDQRAVGQRLRTGHGHRRVYRCRRHRRRPGLMVLGGVLGRAAPGWAVLVSSHVLHLLYPALSVHSATMGYMCGRFAVTTDPALLAQKIQAIDESRAAADAQGGNPQSPGRGSAAPNYAAPNYNVAPTTDVATVVRRHHEPDDQPTRRVRLMRWGLIPPWAKTAEDGRPDTKGPLLINARADRVTTSPA